MDRIRSSHWWFTHRFLQFLKGNFGLLEGLALTKNMAMAENQTPAPLNPAFIPPMVGNDEASLRRITLLEARMLGVGDRWVGDTVVDVIIQ